MGTSLGLQEESALYPHHTYPKGRGHKSVCVRQGPLPCSLPNAHFDLTLAGLSVRGRDTGALTAQCRTSVRLMCSHTPTTTSATVPGPELNFAFNICLPLELSWALN